MGILIRGGRAIDAQTHLDGIRDIYIDEGKIMRIGQGLKQEKAEDRVLDAAGCIVMPGIVDLHVHLRDPGQTYKEDIGSGSQAAAAGGTTTIVAMPNTIPVIDSSVQAAIARQKAAREAKIHILQAGSLTKGQEGRELSDMAGMAREGIRVLSEDGKSVMNAALCRDAFRQAHRLGMLVCDHCEDINLRGEGCMNEDENARRLGLPGISNSVEDVLTARDILLAMETGVRLHLCHVSTRGVVEMLRLVRKLGYDNITAEACPHHLILSSSDILSDDPMYKMNPPLRRPEDVQALRDGLREGLIQAISTDHAPHAEDEKKGSMKTAAFGIVGLETSLPLIYTELVEKGVLSLEAMVEKMCLNPARILGLPCGRLTQGAPADVIVADMKTSYRIDRNSFVSKGRNTPFNGRQVRGRVLVTICQGDVVYQQKTFPACQEE